MLALPRLVFEMTPQLHASKISEIDGVIFLAFLAVNHLVSRSIRKYSFNEKAAIRASDFPQGQVLCFQLGYMQLAPDLWWNVVFLVIGSDLIHSKSPAFPNPISPVMYSESSCLLRIPNSLSRIRNAANDTPIALAISRTSNLSSTRRILSP